MNLFLEPDPEHVDRWMLSGVTAAAIRHVDVLCGCGWGRLAVREDTVPELCPMCGRELAQGGD